MNDEEINHVDDIADLLPHTLAHSIDNRIVNIMHIIDTKPHGFVLENVLASAPQTPLNQ